MGLCVGWEGFWDNKKADPSPPTIFWAREVWPALKQAKDQTLGIPPSISHLDAPIFVVGLVFPIAIARI